MKRSNYLVFIIVLAVIPVAIISGCYSFADKQYKEPTPLAITNETEVDAVVSDNSTDEYVNMSREKQPYDWAESYVTYLNDVDIMDYSKASVIFVNDDDIPEIFLQGNANYNGSKALTIGNDGTVKEHRFSSQIPRYIEKMNIIYDFNEGGGGADDDISIINNGEWETLFLGNYTDIWDESGNTVGGKNYHIYDKGYWEEDGGRLVTEEEYKSTMKSIIDDKGYEEVKAKKVEYSYSVNELITMLEENGVLPGE